MIGIQRGGNPLPSEGDLSTFILHVFFRFSPQLIEIMHKLSRVSFCGTAVALAQYTTEIGEQPAGYQKSAIKTRLKGIHPRMLFGDPGPIHV
jgi:hypothetical protein